MSSIPVKEHVTSLLNAMRFMGERAHLAQGPVRRSNILREMALVEEKIKSLATMKDPDVEVITAWKEAVVLMKAIRRALPHPEDRSAIDLNVFRLMASGAIKVLERLRILESNLDRANSFSDLVEVGGLMAAVATMNATALAELPSTERDSRPANMLELYAVCAEITQAAGLAQELGAKISAILASRLT